MKVKNLILIASLLVAVFLTVSWSVIGLTNDRSNLQKLDFKTKTAKSDFVLGEPVEVVFEIQNQGEKRAAIPDKGVETGALDVFISKQNEDYKKYVGYGWGRKFSYGITLEPGRAYEYKAVILWNGKPKVSHLNPQAAKRIVAGKITTEYAFSEPGVYLIKGSSYFGGSTAPVESEPVKIVINEPTGEDLKVWNQIKGNREIALLMQAGEFGADKEEEKEKLVGEVEQIILQYPNSIYTSYLKPNLEKYKASELRRKSILNPK